MREAGERRDYERAIRHRDALRELTFFADFRRAFALLNSTRI